MRLSSVLAEKEFLNVLGWTESRPSGERYEVKPGTPYTFGENNGVVAVYDEEGVPWITRDEKFNLRDFVGFSLRETGAKVPFSNMEVNSPLLQH